VSVLARPHTESLRQIGAVKLSIPLLTLLFDVQLFMCRLALKIASCKLQRLTPSQVVDGHVLKEISGQRLDLSGVSGEKDVYVCCVVLI